MADRNSDCFSSLSLSKPMLDNLKNLKYHTMTDIQRESIPPILHGEDVLALAKTGSGKTAAFGIGLLENLNTKRYRVQALVLCPTRELATQVTDELRRLARFEHNLKLVTLTGGMPMYRQELSLKHQAHVAIGTPGRLLKLLHRGALVLDEVKTVVLDEADRMLEMGFIDQVSEILDHAPRKRQTLCFSATFPEEIKRFTKSIMNNPREISVESHHDESVISQTFYEVPAKDKAKAAIEILAKHNPDSTIIFCNTKDQCRRVRAELNKAGLHSLALHGDLDQKERTVALIRFANSSSKVLVATDVAARGIDIDDLAAVINYDLPFEPETYVHRIGRTGRAGREGIAVSLMVPGEEFRIEAINENMGTDFEPEAPDFEYGANHPELEPPMVTLSINGGRKNKISAGDILGTLTSKGGIQGSDVGKIDRLDFLTFVAVKRDVAEKALKIVQSTPVKGKRFLAMIND